MKRAVLIIVLLLAIPVLGMRAGADAPQCNAGGRTLQPSDYVRSPAEFESSDGALISWPTYDPACYAFHRDMTREIAKAGICYIVVSDSGKKTSVQSYLSGQGVPLGNVTFVIVNTDSLWIRDYGPFFVLDSAGNKRISNFAYDMSRPNDDAFPAAYGALMGYTIYSADLSLQGGNYMNDGCDRGYANSIIYSDNIALSESQVDQVICEYNGLRSMGVGQEMTSDGTGHIDMGVKLLSPSTVLVSDCEAGNPDHAILDNTARIWENRTTVYGTKFNVVRLPLVHDESSTDTIYETYTNSLIVNKRVLVPVYGIAEDSAALVAYRSAMPGYTIVGIDSSYIIPQAGAVHCATMQVPKNNKRPVVSHTPQVASGGQPIPVPASVTDDGSVSAVTMCYNTSANPATQKVAMTKGSGSDYACSIPAQAAGTQVKYWVVATDNDNAVATNGSVEKPHIITVSPAIASESGLLIVPVFAVAVTIILRKRRD